MGVLKALKGICCAALCGAVMLVSPVSGNVVYAEESSAAVTEAVTELPYEVEEQEEEGVLTAEEQSILDYLDVNNSTNTIDLVLLITIISIAPSLLVMMTCFTRLIISFSLLRNAMGIATTPPNQVLVGLAAVNRTAAHIAITDHGCRLFLGAGSGDQLCQAFFADAVSIPAAIDAVPPEAVGFQNGADFLAGFAVKVDFQAVELCVLADLVCHSCHPLTT